VGGPGAYLDRPGFWHGGIGVAATALADTAARRGPDPLRDAALGSVDLERLAARFGAGDRLM
jgi:hypothetical protein